jgi:hypothetical protein
MKPERPEYKAGELTTRLRRFSEETPVISIVIELISVHLTISVASLCPDRLCGPLSILYNEYRGSFTGGKTRLGRDGDLSHPSSTEANEMALYHSPPLCLHGVYGTAFLFFYFYFTSLLNILISTVPTITRRIIKMLLFDCLTCYVNLRQ